MIIGIDPGGRETGIVARDGDALHYWALITREADLDTYILEVIETIREQMARVPATIAIEDITDPNPHMGMMAVRGIIDTAQVLGAVASHFPVLRIPPGGHGSGPLSAYPPALVGAGERKGTGRLRHCRAAWSIAGAAETMTRLAAAQG